MDQIITKTKSLVPEKAQGFAAEFRAFAISGNVLDLAVAVVIGAAFNAIVTSLVNDIIMPLIALIFGKPSFAAIVWGPVHIGSFINQIVNFLIVALSIFVVLKFVLRKKFETVTETK